MGGSRCCVRFRVEGLGVEGPRVHRQMVSGAHSLNCAALLHRVSPAN